ncbi:MAG: DUF21 domain-containing protein [Planctomycetes bacterium]|nr:DUF21 domain-containing protein [Planctomycetota bacterium]
MTITADAVLLAGALVCEAFFSGAETASYAVSRIRLRYLADEGNALARRSLRLVSNHPSLVVTTLVGTNVAVYISGKAAMGITSAFVPDRARAELYATLLLTPLVFVFAEITSKWWFRRSADSWFPKSSRLLSIFQTVFAPAVWLLLGAAAALRRLLPVKDEAVSLAGMLERAFSRQGIHEYIRGVAAERGLVKPSQQSVLDVVLRRFRGAVANVAEGIVFQAVVGPEATVGEAVEMAARYDDAAVLVEDGAFGFGGVVYLYDLVGMAPEEPVAPAIKEVAFVRADAPVEEVLEGLRATRRSVGVVTDERRVAIGVVTVTRIMDYLLHGRPV